MVVIKYSLSKTLIVLSLLCYSRTESSSDSNESVKATHNNVISRRNHRSKPCESCTKKEIESQIPKNTLRSLRLQLIKDQILRKLGLKEIPKSEDVILPSPLVAMGELKKRHKSEERDFEDFYGKTEQIVVLGDSVECSSVVGGTCFTFDFSSVRAADEINGVEFWVFKWNGGPEGLEVYDEMGQVLLIEEVVGADAEFGWVSLNITRVFLELEWLDSRKVTFSIKNCSIGKEGAQRPFIIFNMKAVSKRRSRRHVNCSPGLTECCRERLVVNFREIGLNFIIAPDSYETFFCKGTCNGSNGLSSSGSRRTTFVLKQLGVIGGNNRRGNESTILTDVVPCCSPTKMKSIDLIYRENNTVKYETLPNMVIEACGCM